MKRWPTKSLLELCSPKQWPTISIRELTESGFPVYGANGFIGYFDSYNHAEPTILITCRGATCGTLNISPPRAYVTGNAMALDNPRLETVTFRFLFYALLNRGLNDIVTGAAQPQITRANLSRVSIPVPPLGEQERIARLLDEADELRKLRTQADRRTANLIPALFHEMFEFPSEPPQWPVKRLGELVRPGDKINYGVVQPGPGVPDGVPLVRVGDFNGFRVSTTNIKRISPEIEKGYSRSRLKGDEILISCVGAPGLVVLADDSVRGANIARAVARVPLSSFANRTFMACYLRSASAQRFFRSETRTVSQPTLNILQIQQTPVPLPPLPLQEEFAKWATEIRELETDQAASRERVDALFQSMLHRAFRGEL